MGDFFDGRRRKLGIASLLLACGFVGLWCHGQSAKSAPDVRAQITNHSAYGIRLMPKRIQVLRYLTIQYENKRATGAQTLIEVSYWKLATPLALISAYLLLYKPHSNKISVE